MINNKGCQQIPERKDPVFAALDSFLQYTLVERNVWKAGELIAEDIYFLGASEAIFCRQQFVQMLEREINYVGQPVRYHVSDFRKKLCGESVWSCYGQLAILGEGTEHPEEEYTARLTTVIREKEGRYEISVLHRTILSSITRKEENFPFRIISNQVDRLDQTSRRELLELLCETMPNGIIGGYIEEGYPVYMVNDTFLELLGYTYEEFIEETGGNVANRIWKEDREEAVQKIMQQCREKGEYEIEYRMKKKDGNFLWVYDKGRNSITQDGKQAILSLVVDISENVRIKNHLFVESVTDPLTGLYNRRGGEVMVTQKLVSRRPYIFLMMDIDNFKAVNDMYGHHEGDNVLKYIADQLKHFFRSDDMIIRLGGDEFVIFVHPCSNISAIENKLLEISRIYREKMEQEYPKSCSTLSFGGVCDDRPHSFVELYKKADEILYEIKHQNKGHFRIENMRTETV